MTVTFVIVPISLVKVASLIGHLALTLLHAFGPLALVYGAILVPQLAVTVTHSVNPLTFVFDAFFLVHVNALSVPEAVHNLALVGGAIRPLVATFASNLVLTELTFVHGVVGPFKSSFTMEEPMSQLTLVLMTIFKNTSALTVVHFTNLSKCYSRIKLTCPFF